MKSVSFFQVEPDIVVERYKMERKRQYKQLMLSAERMSDLPMPKDPFLRRVHVDESNLVGELLSQVRFADAQELEELKN